MNRRPLRPELSAQANKAAHSREIGHDFGEIAMFSRVAFAADYDLAATTALAEEG
jgi:hypothetical protein